MFDKVRTREGICCLCFANHNAIVLLLLSCYCTARATDQPALVAEEAVCPHQHIVRHSLSEHLHTHHVSEDLLSLLPVEEDRDTEWQGRILTPSLSYPKQHVTRLQQPR